MHRDRSTRRASHGTSTRRRDEELTDGDITAAPHARTLAVPTTTTGDRSARRPDPPGPEPYKHGCVRCATQDGGAFVGSCMALTTHHACVAPHFFHREKYRGNQRALCPKNLLANHDLAACELVSQEKAEDGLSTPEPPSKKMGSRRDARLPSTFPHRQASR